MIVIMCCSHVPHQPTDVYSAKKIQNTNKNLLMFHKDIISCILANLKHMCSNLFPVSPGDSAEEAR